MAFDLAALTWLDGRMVAMTMAERQRRYHAAHPERKAINAEQNRRAQFKRKYGITPEDYDRMLAEQGGGCAICGGQQPTRGRRYLCVDHDHTTGKVRGLLCDPCNRGLAAFRDDPDRIRAAIVFLQP